MTKMSILCTTIFLAGLALTPLSDAAISFQEILCMRNRPELSNCYLQCLDGRAWKDGCPTCACRSSLCQQKFCPNGQHCTIQQQIGQYPDQITHVAVCVFDDRNQPLATQPTVAPTTAPPTEFHGSCDFQGRCDSNGKCASQDAICRSDGWCCKVKLPGYDLGGLPINVSRCLDTADVGTCRALGVQYVFNREKGKCESMMYGGCVNSGNSFFTLENCQRTCEHPCQKPKTEGRCRASIPRYYFNEAKEICEPFDLGGCAGTADYFMTPGDCEAHCKGLKKKFSQTITEDDRGVTRPTTPTYVTSSAPGNHQNDRETLRNQIINNFRRREPAVQSRGNPPELGEGKLRYKQRPGGSVYRVDEFGNLILVTANNKNNNNYLQRTTQTPPTDRSNREDAFTHLGDRIRSAQQIFNNFERGQVNYNYPRLRFSGRSLPANRVYTSAYQRSAASLRNYLDG